MEDKNDHKKKKKKKKFRGLRIFGRILLALATFILLIILFVRSPWGQNIIKDRLISSISDKTNTRIEVERLFITFSGNIFIDGLYLEDKKGDTLVYSKELEADIPLWPIIRGQGIAITSVDWNGVRANITRKDTINGFNFSFLMEALAPADSTATAQTTQDTTTSSQEFRLGEINLQNFDVVYNDAVTGIDSRFRVGELYLEMEETNLENMNFHASNASISNSIIDYKQMPVPDTPSEEDVPLPVFRIDELELEKVAANYESVPGGILAQVQLEKFLLELPQANLAENFIEVNDLQMNNSKVLLKMTQNPESEVTSEPVEETSEGFQWPEWKIEVANVDFRNNEITYLTNDAKPEAGVFNPGALEFQEFDLAAQDIYLRNENAGADINSFNFIETGGIQLKNFSLDAGIDNTSLIIDDLLVELNNNRLEGNLDIQYDSMDDLINNPENAVVDANLPEFHLDLKDLFLIQPNLRTNEYLLALSQKPVTGQIQAEGTLASLKISGANINWGATTSIAARGSIQNPTEPENLQFNFPRIRMVSRRGDIRRFVDEDSLGVKLPEKFSLTANVSGNTEDIEAVANLDSSEGDIALDGSFSSSTGISFNADIEITDLALGNILQNEQLGNLNLTLEASGEGENMNELDAMLDANISSFYYNNYAIEDLRITGELTDGSGLITSDYEDENLNMELESFVILDSVAPQVNLSLNVIGANLEKLGLTQKDIRVGFELDGSFRGTAESYDVNAEISDGVTVYNTDSYLLGNFGVSARVRPDSTAVDIQNQMIDLRLRSNTDPASFATALQRHYQSYFSDDIEIDTVNNPVNLELRAEIRENPILDEVFITSLEEMDTINIAVDFHERNRELTADVELPFINYMGNEIDSLSFRLDSGRENLEFVLGFNALNAGPLSIRRTDLEGEIINEILHLDFNSYYEDEHLMHIRSELARRNDTIIFQLDPSEVILNSSLWEVPEDNEIRIAENSTIFNDFRFTRNNQSLRITNEQPGIDGEHIGILFENFRLQSFLSYLNPETPLASGRLNGNFTIQDPSGSTGLLAGLEINEFNVMEVPMGTLTLEADAIGYETYNFDMAIKGGNVDLDLEGSFNARETGAEWDTELLLNEVQMAVVEGFSQGEITETSGSFSGKITLGGTTAEPEYEGSINFNNAALTVAMLDAPFVIPNETLRLDNEGFYFDSFTIEDKNNNNFMLNGEVLTESFINPSFDLEFEANDFMLLNSTAEDNELYYGTAVVDANGSLTGTLNVPKVDLNLTVESQTDITYVIPPSEVAIESREGVVVFVNRENPDDILTSGEEEAYTFSGLQINSVISVNEDAVFNVIIDEQTGDNFRVTGSGDLNFNIYDNGRTTLSGRYEMSGGHYEMNLYGLVNRRFEIVEGSTITWLGDPLDANLDITARYRVETSASSLMAAQTTGAAADERERFRQELPFLVYLNIDGEIMQPVLSFGLDMPETEQGAIGGQVYGRVQQINQQEQELNKQVFSLLVLNRFYPEGTSDGSGGGTLGIARDNLNNALSDQLNLLSNNLLGDSGIALDFGLDTFTDYQGDSPQERTQLDIAAETTFMDDRLVVSVGSEVDIQGSSQQPGEANPLIGNVSIEYLITEDGRWRLKGFRRNSFENFIEGQVIVSGIALIFTREFNEFRELWDSLNGNENGKEEEETEIQSEEQ